MMAVPVSLPRFSIKDVDTKGVLQVYFKEKNKLFTPLEAKIAEVLSRRVSYVIAQKQIIDLQKLNVTKNKIVEQIFLKLGKRQGVKMREVFNLVVPELVHIMQIQRCSLFSVSEDRSKVILEAGYPEKEHGIGKTLSAEAPYIDAIINQPGPFGEFWYEKVFPAYILITDPQKSRLLPPDLKRMLESHQINSVLYIPLSVSDQVNYFLAFDAQAHHKRFKDEEIELFTFFGKELMKGAPAREDGRHPPRLQEPGIAVGRLCAEGAADPGGGRVPRKEGEGRPGAGSVIVTESPAHPGALPEPPRRRPRGGRRPDGEAQEALPDQRGGRWRSSSVRTWACGRPAWSPASGSVASPSMWNGFWTTCSTTPRTPFPTGAGRSRYAPFARVPGRWRRSPTRAISGRRPGTLPQRRELGPGAPYHHPPGQADGREARDRIGEKARSPSGSGFPAVLAPAEAG